MCQLIHTTRNSHAKESGGHSLFLSRGLTAKNKAVQKLHTTHISLLYIICTVSMGNLYLEETWKLQQCIALSFFF